MKFHGIASTQSDNPIIRLGKGSPNLLALDHRGEILPVFGLKTKLQAFVRDHPSLKIEDPDSVEAVLLGANYIELAELIYPAVQSGQVKMLVFDPVLDTHGEWVGKAFDWPTDNFCELMIALRPILMDIARRQEGVPTDRPPSPEAVQKAFTWWVDRARAYLDGTSRLSREATCKTESSREHE